MHSVLVWMITLVITLSVAVFAKGMMKLIPICLVSLLAGGFVLFLGLINFQPVLDAKWFELPELTKPEFN